MSWHKGKKFSEKHKEKLRIKRKGRKPNLGKHHTEETIKRISNSLKGRKFTEEHRKKKSEAQMGKKNPVNYPGVKEKISKTIKNSGTSKGKNNPMYGKPRAHGKGCYYDSPLQGKVWLRSSYELKYTQYLDKHKILWMYEIEIFDLGNITYTPDFFLPKYEKFVEIKGYMFKNSQERINKFIEQYPWDLEILYKEDLIKLGIKL